jgi:hypothetical protein
VWRQTVATWLAASVAKPASVNWLMLMAPIVNWPIETTPHANHPMATTPLATTGVRFGRYLNEMCTNGRPAMASRDLYS